MNTNVHTAIRCTLHRWIAYCLPIRLLYRIELFKKFWAALCAGYQIQHSQRRHFWHHSRGKGTIMEGCTLTALWEAAVQSQLYKQQSQTHSFCDGKWGSASWFIWMRGIKHPGYSRSLHWSKTIYSNYKCGTVRYWGLTLLLPRQLGIIHCFTTIAPRSTEGWHSILVDIPLAAGYAPQMDKTL